MRLKRLFVAAVVLLGAGNLMAQQMPLIPVDKNVKIGRLDNGLTYYIRHNAYPEHVASFYIAQKVGSINENDDQRGLAHLLEHLAFNGTDHFKDNDLQEYLQSIGVEYGRNLNAYTSIDQTVYYFTDVPTVRPTAVDSCMLILKDWSNGISLTKKAIDDERDVVHNEYRMRMVGQQRMLERSLPALYAGNKYGYRMPIGLMSIIDGCNPETLRAYYRKWYRPDNQAIIVVGDVDVNKIEAKIKELFGGIKVPANAAKVIPVMVPDNDKPIYVVDKDKEMQFDVILTMMKNEVRPDSLKGTVDYLIEDYIKDVLSSMINARFAEKANEPNCPFLQASAGEGDFLISRTKGAFQLQTVAKSGLTKEALEAALLELKRLHDYGFTATEYARAKADYLSSLEKAYTNRDKMKNEQFTSQYVANFIANEPIPSVEDEYKLMNMIVPNIPVEAVNEYAKKYISESDTNLVTFAMLQEKDGNTYPTEKELADVVAKVRNAKVEAYVDNVKQEPLVAQMPKAGKIVKTSENQKLGYKQYVLSNGAKVILKKTDFKDDEVRFMAVAKGGAVNYPEKDAANLTFASMALRASGLGNFSNTELDKALAGKQASANIFMNNYNHGLSGASTPKDLETLFQLIYQKFNAVSKDEKSFENLKNTYVTYLANQSENPDMVYQDSVNSTIYKGNKFFRTPKSEDVKKLDYDFIMKAYKAFFNNAKDFTFYFVGNFDEAVIKPFIEQYIASLPTSKSKFAVKEFQTYKGELKNNFTKEMANPQSQATEEWRSNKVDYTLQNNVVVDIAGRLLEMKYNRSIRENLSAAYHAGASSDYDVDPNANKAVYTITGSAQLNPDKQKEAVPCFFTGMDETIANPDAADLVKAQQILLKQADVDAKTNGYWLGVLRTFVERGIDMHTDYKKTVSATDAKAISAFLKNVILAGGNHAEIIMTATQKK